MKKFLIIVSLFIAFLQESQAKVQAGVGVKVGPTFGRWNDYFLSDLDGTLSFQPGLHAGIQGRVWFNKFVGLNLATEFNMSGSKLTVTQGSVITSLTHKENQITIPLTAMVGWGNERLRVFGNIGGYFGYIFNGTDNTAVNNNGSKSSTGDVKADYDNVYRNIDGGVRLGAGMQVYVDKKSRSCITLDINYDYGMVKVFRGTPFFDNNGETKLLNSKLMVGVGFIYTFGKNQSEEKPKRLGDSLGEL